MSTDSSDSDRDLAEAATDVLLREIDDPDVLEDAGFHLVSEARKIEFNRSNEEDN